MRKISLTLAIACTVTAGAFVSSASATTLSTPANVKAAIEHSNILQEAAYYCRRVRRCNAAGYCVWRRVCRVW